jgi:hypothetical protein
MKQKIEEKKNSVEIGIDYEHQKAQFHLIQQHRNSKNSPITTRMIAGGKTAGV